jgi:hypothetical protein
MTEKEPIMINDVDVSGCEYFEGFDCMLEPYDQEYCCSWRDNCYYKQLKRKDLEIEKYKDLALHNGKVCNERLDKIDELEHKVNRMEEGYIELTEIIAPYIDDFTGYNEEQCGFDIVLCIKELMQQLDQLKEEVEKQRALKQTYLACYKTKHGDVKGKLFKYETYKQSLQDIWDIANDAYCGGTQTSCENGLKEIMQKCEVLNDK